jgi:hypothetical protein
MPTNLCTVLNYVSIVIHVYYLQYCLSLYHHYFSFLSISVLKTLNKAIMGPSNATIVALDGPIIALLIIHTQQEATPQ